MIDVLVTRRLSMRGTAHEVGTILNVAPLDAADLIRSGRAQLVDPADIGVLNDAERAHTRKVCHMPSRPFERGRVS
jgi:hypothetical protein